MDPDIDRKMLRQLIWIKWSTIAIALTFFAIAGAVVWFTVLVNQQLPFESGERSFSERTSEMLDQGKEQEVLALAESREKAFPKDVSVYWYRGRALYQLGLYDDALAAFSKAEELAPSWKVAHTEPFISSIKAKQRSGNPESVSHRPGSVGPR